MDLVIESIKEKEEKMWITCLEIGFLAVMGFVVLVAIFKRK